MSYFITPKHSGSIECFLYSLLALRGYGQSQWVATEDFKESLFRLYVQNHIDSEWVLDENGNKVMKKDSSDYTKDLQLPAYFGFAEADSFQRNSNKRITQLGEFLLKEYELAGNTLDCEAVKDLFLIAMETVSFGRNNYGVINSDSNIEAPALFLKSAIILEGLSTKEFAYIIEQLENNKDFSQVIIDIKRRRRLNLSLKSSISTDIKFITLFKNIGILVDGPERNLNYVCPFYIDRRYDRVSALPIDNRDKEQNAADNSAIKNTDMSKYIQQIYYGAPGTGKSNEIKKMTAEDGLFAKDCTFRTTFHPDSDYASFVGAYKPYWDKDKDKIVYGFRPQAFLKAYIKAWKNPAHNVALVVEEINRGNCAQIFGDIFQLLDREKNGLSKYPIECDVEMQELLAGEFEEGIDKDNKEIIDGYYSAHYKDAFVKIKNGEILALPMNLSILATMNTSDQSLFPMDSAFKRRWEWIYEPIVEGKKEDGTSFGWTVELDDARSVNWWNFLQKINAVIYSLTSSEDKQLGYFFCQPDKEDGMTISKNMFVGKVVFYLWNEIFKDYAFEHEVCKKANKSDTLYFADFYEGKDVIKQTSLVTFFKHLDENQPKIENKDIKLFEEHETATENTDA